MASTFTPNIQLNEPARNDDVGTWDTPVNSNMTLIDLVAGGIATIALNNSPVVLSAAQFQAKQITFNSTLTGSVAITFPTSFTKSYEIQNLCSGSSAFVITLGTTASGQVICCPPGETIDCFNDGTNLKFKNLGRVGSYMDDCGSSVAAWISGCTVPPYLNCDGTSFSSATYPVLVVRLAGTTLPDFRGGIAAYLNQGTGRMTTAGAGVDGNTNLARGGSNGVTLVSSQLPVLGGNAFSPNGSNNFVTAANRQSVTVQGGSGATFNIPDSGSVTVNAGSASVTINGVGGGTPVPLPVPATVGGIRLIRAG